MSTPVIPLSDLIRFLRRRHRVNPFYNSEDRDHATQEIRQALMSDAEYETSDIKLVKVRVTNS
jgi:hypothetical protein